MDGCESRQRQGAYYELPFRFPEKSGLGEVFGPFCSRSEMKLRTYRPLPHV